MVHLFQFRNAEWKGLLAPVLPGWLKDSWKYYPYNLKNALLDAAHYSEGMTEDQKVNLISILNDLLETEKNYLMMPTSIMEALQVLGALEDDEMRYHEVARAELTAIFSDENDLRKKKAFGFHQKTFDHPHHGVYWQVLDELSPVDAKKLYHMAVKGAARSEYNWVCNTRCHDSQHSKTHLQLTAFLRYRRLPFRKSSTPQEAIETFKLAHIIVGWLGKEMSFAPDTSQNTPAIALRAYGEILYWLNRRDLSRDVRKKIQAGRGACCWVVKHLQRQEYY